MEKFTERTRKVIGLARQEAVQAGSEFIGTEHALAALALEGDGIGAQILETMKITLDRIRQEAGKLITPSTSPTVTLGQLPYAPRLKHVFELAWEFACKVGSEVIGTEHLLVGLVKENEGIACQILVNMNVDPMAVENKVLELVCPEFPAGKSVKVCTHCHGTGKEPSDLKAGRVLDAAIMLKVFGKTSCLCCHSHGTVCEIHDGPSYSTDLVQAWTLVDLFGFMVQGSGPGIDGQVAGYWVGYPRDGYAGLVGDMENATVAFAVTAPHAICLAALKAAAKSVAKP